VSIVIAPRLPSSLAARPSQPPSVSYSCSVHVTATPRCRGGEEAGRERRRRRGGGKLWCMSTAHSNPGDRPRLAGEWPVEDSTQTRGGGERHVLLSTAVEGIYKQETAV
jgi:hypothetical protein